MSLFHSKLLRPAVKFLFLAGRFRAGAQSIFKFVPASKNPFQMFQQLYDWYKILLETDAGMSGGSLDLSVLGLMLISVIIVSWIVFKIVRQTLVGIIHRFAKRTTSEWDDVLVERKFFRYVSLLLPGVVLLIAVDATLTDFENVLPYANRFVRIYFVFVFLSIVSSFLNALGDVLQGYPAFEDKPIRSYTQVGKILFALVAVIFTVAILMGRSPVYILTGLGAVTAILLLLFRDPILGLVASIQMSTIDMVRMGDWITMPKYGADGNVVEINLTSLKVQNFDKTITIIPSYAFISDSFTNWRGMADSGGRRIKRHVNIKISSIHFVDDKLMQKLKKLEILKDYLQEKADEIKKYNNDHNFDDEVLLNGRRLTNIGVYRIYAQELIKRNENIHPEMIAMVRQLQSGDSGVPIEIYAFSKDQRWPFYEAIMADIFDHLLAATSYFDLEIFQNPSGADFQALAALRESSES
jgi:miniconductance mechanosensitive channel